MQYTRTGARTPLSSLARYRSRQLSARAAASWRLVPRQCWPHDGGVAARRGVAAGRCASGPLHRLRAGAALWTHRRDLRALQRRGRRVRVPQGRGWRCLHRRAVQVGCSCSNCRQRSATCTARTSPAPASRPRAAPARSLRRYLPAVATCRTCRRSSRPAKRASPAHGSP